MSKAEALEWMDRMIAATEMMRERLEDGIWVWSGPTLHTKWIGVTGVETLAEILGWPFVTEKAKNPDSYTKDRWIEYKGWKFHDYIKKGEK